jgi:hypothetical protein
MFYKISLHFQLDIDFPHVPYNGILIAYHHVGWLRWVSGLLVNATPMGGSSLEPPVHFEPAPTVSIDGFAPARVAATGKKTPLLHKTFIRLPFSRPG